jgi:hypothetical protein
VIEAVYELPEPEKLETEPFETVISEESNPDTDSLKTIVRGIEVAFEF